MFWWYHSLKNICDSIIFYLKKNRFLKFKLKKIGDKLEFLFYKIALFIWFENIVWVWNKNSETTKISWFVGYSLFHRQQIDFVTNCEVGPKETILGFQTKNDKIQPKEIISGLSLHF